MKINYSNENLFPVIMHCFDCEGFNEIKNVLINQAYDLMKSDPEGLSISNRGGWHSKPFIVNDKDCSISNSAAGGSLSTTTSLRISLVT